MPCNFIYCSLSGLYNILDWDSKFFGYKIAAIQAPNLKFAELKVLIKELKAQDFKLAYCFVSPDDEITNTSLRNVEALLVDQKVTFFMRIDELTNFQRCAFVKPFNLPSASEKLKSLALQSGIFSRFKIDTNFKNNEFEKLYLEWIEKSVKRVIAQEVLVYVENEDEKGLITLRLKKDTGSIGLFAVDEKERGKSIGKKLVQESLLYLKERKISKVEVVAQMENKVACGFYKSLGFNVERIVNIYHLWIH